MSPRGSLPPLPGHDKSASRAPDLYSQRIASATRRLCDWPRAFRTAAVVGSWSAPWAGSSGCLIFPRVSRICPHSKGGVMAHNRTSLSLAAAATILLTLSACSDSPIAPAPVYLMGRTTSGPGGPATVAPPIAPPSHSHTVASAPPGPMMQLQSPSQHQSTQPAIRERGTTVVQKNDRYQVATKAAAHRRTYHAAHASSVAASSSSPEQIPLDEPITAPALSTGPASKAPSSQQPKTSWVSPPPVKDP